MTSQNPVSYIRFCNEGDRDSLLDFVRDGHNESAVFTMSDAKVKKVIDHAINPPKDENGNVNHVVIIGIIDAPDSSGKIAASIAIEYNQMWYSDDWVLYELWNKVRIL